jgi:hypothetical protein
MSSPASVVSVELTPAFASMLLSATTALARSGVNNITLGVTNGFTQDLNFSIVAENGVQGGTFTIRITEVFRNQTAFRLLALGYGGLLLNVTDATLPLSWHIVLSFAAANSIVSLQFTLQPGAVLLPYSLGAASTLTLGGTSSSTQVTFKIAAETGLLLGPYVLSFDVSPSAVNSWTMSITGGGVNSSLTNSSTAAALTVVRVPYTRPAPVDISSVHTLTVWMAGSNCVNYGGEASVGSLLAASDDASPGARYGATSFVGYDGHLYIYAGTYTDGDELWLVWIQRSTRPQSSLLAWVRVLRCDAALFSPWSARVGALHATLANGCGCAGPSTWEPTSLSTTLADRITHPPAQAHLTSLAAQWTLRADCG